jgi:hypothetical protein
MMHREADNVTDNGDKFLEAIDDGAIVSPKNAQIIYGKSNCVGMNYENKICSFRGMYLGERFTLNGAPISFDVVITKWPIFVAFSSNDTLL